MLENKKLPIHFTAHALDSARKRGTNQEEVRSAIQGAQWRAAKLGRIEAEMEFPYNGDWNNRYYQSKTVSPVFIVENQEIIVITVYCFYY